jgi:ClpP class serine protease
VIKALSIASAQPWLITSQALRTILEITARENVLTPDVWTRIAENEARREAVALRRGRRLEDASWLTDVRPNGVAVIDINGPIVRYADMFAEISGATALQRVAMDFTTALESREVKSIILNINSPGGEVAGIHELGEVIYAARSRGKRVVAYGSNWCASAAYWLASACHEIVVDRTAMLPSLGCVFVASNPAGKPVTDIVIVSAQSPKKYLDPSTEAGQTELQRWADRTAGVFVDVVARNRGVTVDIVLSDYGQGSCEVGADAVAAGIADRLGSLEELIEELGQATSPARTNVINKGAKTMAKKLGLAGSANVRSLAGTGACSECTTCTAFTASSDNPETCVCTHTSANHADEAPAPDAAALGGLMAELQAVRGELAQERAGRATAEKEKLKVAANAQVDAWERDGRLTGNATAKVRTIYVAVATGEPVTTTQVEEMIAALPQFDTGRIAAPNVTGQAKSPNTDAPTREDYAAAERGNRTAKVKVDLHVKALAAADTTKNYVAHYKAARAAAFATK